jgi:hypothetical protein
MSETIKKNLYVANYLLEKDIAGRSFQVFSDDIFLVSYPKSGNTWTRFLLGNLMNPHEGITFAKVERKVPDIYAESKLTLKKTPRPRVIKSHEGFDPRYRRVIYIVLYPRDVALSAYHYDRKERNIPDNFPLDTYITTRIMKTDGYYGTWGEHAGSWLVNEKNILQISHLNDGFMGAVGSSGDNVMSWLGARGHDREFLLVRYEDLLEDTGTDCQSCAVEYSRQYAKAGGCAEPSVGHHQTESQRNSVCPFGKVGSVATITPFVLSRRD